jgi:hypothetical protein
VEDETRPEVRRTRGMDKSKIIFELRKYYGYPAEVQPSEVKAMY